MHRYLIEFARFKLHGTLNNDYVTENNLITVFRSLIYVTRFQVTRIVLTCYCDDSYQFMSCLRELKYKGGKPNVIVSLN